MKRNLLWLAFVFLVVISCVAAYRPLMKAIKGKPIEKNISFAIYKENNYSSKIYRNSSAKIYIAVEKVECNTRTLVWDTTFDARLLKSYPSAKKALSQKITIPNIFAKQEHLEMNYVVTYNSNGSVLSMQSGAFILDSLRTIAIGI